MLYASCITQTHAADLQLATDNW